MKERRPRMRRVLRIGAVARIGIFVHWTFPVLVAALFALYVYRGAGPAAAFGAVAMILVLFACVVLHELGHALAAARFGVSTRDITIYPIGGVARLERLPEAPRAELWIALAGPAVNVALAAVLFGAVAATGGDLSPRLVPAPDRGALGALGALAWLNAGLAAFNLLPAFPMDGGRVLRAALALRLPYARATRIAAVVGQAMAVVFAAVGLFVVFNPVLVLIAVFVFSGARHAGRTD